jgi:hypothetical protein
MNDAQSAAHLWERHQHWSTVATRLKAQVSFWRNAALSLSVAGATLQTLSASLERSSVSRAAAVAGALALAAIPFIARSFLGPERVRRWLRARSVSEGLKSEIYKFCARAEPYDGADRTAKLHDSGKALEIWVDSLAIELATVEVDPKPAPPALDPDAYVTQRVTEQIEHYYRPQARKNATGSARLRLLGLIVAGAAAALGAVMTALQLAPDASGKEGLGAWVAVLTTIGGALAAHAAANRYDQQARMYFATARQLEDLRNAWLTRGKPTDPLQWSAFVRACEEAISAENRGWMAKLDPEEQPSSHKPTG